MTFALNVIAAPRESAVPSPSPAHTSHLSTPLCPTLSLSHCLPATPPLPPPNQHSDCWLVVPGDLRPVSMPPEYNWMAEAKEPSMCKRGSRGTDTQTHVHTKETENAVPFTQTGRTGAVLCSILSSIHFSSSSGYPWSCGCVRIHICWVCIWQSDR